MLRRGLLGGVLVLAIAVVGAIVVDQESRPAQEAGRNEYTGRSLRSGGPLTELIDAQVGSRPSPARGGSIDGYDK